MGTHAVVRNCIQIQSFKSHFENNIISCLESKTFLDGRSDRRKIFDYHEQACSSHSGTLQYKQSSHKIKQQQFLSIAFYADQKSKAIFSRIGV